MRPPERSCSLRPQERLDRAALIHGAIALGNLIQRQHQVEDLAGIDRSIQDKINQLGEKTSHWGGAAVEMNVTIEKLLSIQFHAMWDADVPDVPAGARGLDGLHHRLLCADALQYGISTDAFGHVFNAGHCLVTAICHDVCCAEFACKLLAFVMAAHCDDPLGAHL